MFESIVEAVATHAAQNPDKLCVADKDGSYTYGEVWDRARAAAQSLERLGIKKKLRDGRMYAGCRFPHM